MTIHLPADDPALSELPSISEAYQAYFADGLYEQRYPRANHLTLARILEELETGQARDSKPARTPSDLPEPPRILDYGCGSGRYLIPLLDRTRARFWAYDISAAALARLRHRLLARSEGGRVSLIPAKDRAALERALAAPPDFDLALMIFGVLAHVGERDARIALLSQIRDALDPRAGRLILSVPNRRRRFPLQGKSADSGDIRYSRCLGGRNIRLHYHLYDARDLRLELEEAGFSLRSLRAESLLPESWLTRFGWLGRMDAWISRRLPAEWGYGILAVAAPEAAAE